MPKEKIDKKILYKLFWEYLKRSKNYKEYCRWRRRQKQIPCRKTSKGDEARDWVQLLTVLPKKLKGKEVQFESLYRLFGDIHSNSFENWWISNKNFFEFHGHPGIRDIKRVIGSIYDGILEQIKKKGKRKRNPSVGEVREGLINYFESIIGKLFVEINLSGEETSKELGERVAKIISSLRKKREVKLITKYIKFLNWQPLPGGVKKPKAHLQYLKIYDRVHPASGKKGLPVKVLAKNIYPEAQKEEEKQILNPEALIYQILALVEKNIGRAELGKFPRNLKDSR